jgi:CubicO group peptidase (beta-lactamase class C family)
MLRDMAIKLLFVAATLIALAGCGGAVSATTVVVDLATTPAITPTATSAERCAFPNRAWSISARIREHTEHATSWQFSTPEEQGMDSALLARGAAALRKSPALYSFLVVRHDHIVFEEYLHGQDESQGYEIASVSKSILSALVGIALREGYLSSLDQRVADLLPQYFTEASETKKSITLRHLLTMRAGLYWEPETPLDQIKDQPGVIQTIVDAPLESHPGITFGYSTGLAHLMSAVLTEVSGMSTCEFAYTYLLDPLDISVEFWGQDGDGYNTGGWYMYLTPRELARFGLLYLHGGKWGEQQIVPQAWIEESWSKRVSAGYETYYGYWWWISSFGKYPAYSARGGGGQMVYVIPALDMVVVTTSNHAYQGRSGGIDPAGFIQDYIIPAVVSGDS